MKPFYILGLPRSRTAWLSCFMNYGVTSCVHDPARYCDSMSAYNSNLGDGRGIADTGTYILDDWHPIEGAKILIVRRPVQEVIKSLCLFKGDISLHEIRAVGYQNRKLDFIEASPEAMSVNFDDIDRKIYQIWKFLTDSNIIPPESSRVLVNFNIQVNKEEYFSYSSKLLDKIRKKVMTL